MQGELKCDLERSDSILARLPTRKISVAGFESEICKASLWLQQDKSPPNVVSKPRSKTYYYHTFRLRKSDVNGNRMVPAKEKVVRFSLMFLFRSMALSALCIHLSETRHWF